MIYLVNNTTFHRFRHFSYNFCDTPTPITLSPMQENPNEPSKEKEVDRESEKFQSAKLFFEKNY